MLDEIRRLFDHAVWADTRLLQALREVPTAPAEAVREFAHVLGAEETWLSRLEGRPSRTAVWPDLGLAELPALLDSVHQGYLGFIVRLDDPASLSRTVAYKNSAGQGFETPVRDILLQVALHGQYHRGKVNLLLRQAGLEPVPTDFIAFVRGVPAATTPRTR
jgi:uncharacterized damage-inducible protein DinB